MTIDELKFQSPPPMREATQLNINAGRKQAISILASHAGGDAGPSAACPHH